MFARGVSAGIKPTMTAPLMNVAWDRMKSSAVSVSNVPGAVGWESAPSRPSGVPVLNEKRSAQAGVASHSPMINVRAIRAIVLIDQSPWCCDWTSFLRVTGRASHSLVARRLLPAGSPVSTHLAPGDGDGCFFPTWPIAPGCALQEPAAHGVHVEPERLAD